MPESAEIAVIAIVLIALIILGVLLIRKGTENQYMSVN